MIKETLLVVAVCIAAFFAILSVLNAGLWLLITACDALDYGGEDE